MKTLHSEVEAQKSTKRWYPTPSIQPTTSLIQIIQLCTEANFNWLMLNQPLYLDILYGRYILTPTPQSNF